MKPVHTNCRNTGEKWLPGFSRSTSAPVRLFCFPFAGGAASSFNAWRNAFPPHIAVCAIQYPGRETRWGEPGFAGVGELVEALASDLQEYWGGHFAFWGHSFGGLVAFELARRLHGSAKTPPCHLFLSAIRAPDLPNEDPIHHLPDDEFLARLREFGGVNNDIVADPQVRDAFLPVVRQDFRLYEQYRFEPCDPLPVPISVFGGLQDAHAGVADLFAWSSLTCQTFRVRFLEGGHFFHFDCISDLSRYIDEDLEKSLQPAAATTLAQ